MERKKVSTEFFYINAYSEAPKKDKPWKVCNLYGDAVKWCKTEDEAHASVLKLNNSRV